MSLFVRESPIIVSESDTKIFSINLDTHTGDTVTLTSTGLTAQAYKNGTGDDVADEITTGSASVSGNVLTTEKFTGWVGDAFYILVFIATINGQLGVVAKLRVNVEKNKTG